MLDHRRSGIQHKQTIDRYTETSKLLYPDKTVDDHVAEYKGEDDGRTAPAGSVWGSVFNLCNSAIGAGILALPYAVKEVGLGLGVFLLVVMGLILCYTLKIIVWTNRLHPEATSYEKLVLKLYGKGTSILVTVSVIITTFGSCVGFLVIIADLMTAIVSVILEHFNNTTTWLAGRIFITAVLSVIGVLPLASLKNFHSLRFSSTMAIVSVAFTVIVIVIRSAQSFAHVNIAEKIVYFKMGFGIFDALPLICFAFGCHMQVVPIFGELKDNHKNWRVNSVIIVTNIVCMILYSVTGVFGYLAFFECTKGNILTNFTNNDLLVNVARGALSFVIVCHYPPSNYCCREALDGLVFSSPMTTIRRLAWTVGIWFSAAIVAILVPNIDVVFGLVGATANSLIVFIFPALFLISEHTQFSWGGLRGIPAYVVGIVVLCIGIMISILGTLFIVLTRIESVAQYFQPHAPVCP